MDQVGIPDKVNFHKQASEILYSDLLKSYLSKIKLEEKVSKLEDQLRREKAASKGWKTQAKEAGKRFDRCRIEHLRQEGQQKVVGRKGQANRELAERS